MTSRYPTSFPALPAPRRLRLFATWVLAGVLGLELPIGPGLAAAEAVLPPAAQATKRSFDLPEGEAFATLKRFFAQSGEQVIYRADAMEGVRTHPVKGDFTPLEALRRMLNSAAFIVSRDEQTGILAIKTVAPPPERRRNAAPDEREQGTFAKKKSTNP